MEKAVIILDGISEGKTTFIRTAMDNKFWVWNFNFKNLLSMVAHKVGWDGERNSNYYSFIDAISLIANEHFDFENWYVQSMLDKFFSSDRVDLAIIHNCNNTIRTRLQEEYNCYDVFITDKEEDICDNEVYCKVLNCNDPEYTDNIIAVLKTMTKDFSEKGDDNNGNV